VHDYCANNSFISVLHFNTQSLRNKLGELEVILQDIPAQFLCINEHWLSKSEIHMYSPKNYRLINYFCRDNNYGGVAIYFKEDFVMNYELLDFSQICEPKFFEIVGVKIQRFRLILISLYRVPGTNMAMFLEKLDMLHHILKKYSQYAILITGDINVDVLKDDCINVKKIQNTLNSFNLKYFNILPTRNESCLDNIIANIDSDRLICGTIEPRLSDHLGLWAIYAASMTPNFPIDVSNPNYLSHCSNNQETTTRMYRSLQISNILSLRTHLQMIDFDRLLNSNFDIQIVWNTFIEVLQTAVQVCCPLRTSQSFKRKPKNNAPWFNQQLKNLKSCLFYWYHQIKVENPIALNKYKALKLKYRNEIIKAKIVYNDSFIKNSKNVNKTAWQLIKNETMQHKGITKIDIPPDVFNNHFVNASVQNDCKLSNFSNKSDTITKNLDNQPSDRTRFGFHEVSPSEIVLTVKNLKCSSSEDIYGFSSTLLKHIIDIIYRPLCYMINKSIIQGIFPKILKRTIVVPIYKKGDVDDPNNYRQIALVPIISKVIESIMKDQIYEHLKKYDLIYSGQYGFRSGMCTIDAVEKVIREIIINFEQRKVSSATFIDISKAFDSISHYILLQKLKLYGIYGKDLEMIRSYLLDREQVVKVSGKISQSKLSNRGVPQGSVLGPILFIMYMNDLHKSLISHPILYADDTTILSAHTDLVNLNKINEIEMCNVKTWLEQNELVLNQNKTENIVFSLNNEIVNSNRYTSVKLLGIYLDGSLSWNEHVEKVINKLSKSIYILRRLKFSLSINYLKLVYHALCHSHISYGILLWGGAPRWKEIFIWQKKAIRIIYGIPPGTSCRGIFRELNILTVPCTFIFQSVVYTKVHFNDYLVGSTIHSYNTRNSKLISIPKTRLSKVYNSYKIQGPKFFNMLPLQVKNFSTRRFKGILKKLLIECEGYTFQEIENFLINYDFTSCT
jgi:hypothetical protein